MTRILLLLSISLSLLCGCNSDVFVDEMPDDLSATIEADGGEAEFSIATKHLKWITLDVLGGVAPTYYDTEGNIADFDIPASRLGKIVFATWNTELEITKSGRRITVRSVKAPSATYFTWSIRLEYSYTVKFINVEIL